VSIPRKELVEFVRARGMGVVSTVSKAGTPEAALVNLAVTDDFELIFYALEATRKCANLRRNPRIAAVVGWDGPRTLQIEGIADEPREPELSALKRIYATSRPDAGIQLNWPGLVYLRVRPKWARFSDYGPRWSVSEMTFETDPPRRR
jgi:hypothetical protein